jgi:hypothetical protein
VGTRRDIVDASWRLLVALRDVKSTSIEAACGESVSARAPDAATVSMRNTAVHGTPSLETLRLRVCNECASCASFFSPSSPSPDWFVFPLRALFFTPSVRCHGRVYVRRILIKTGDCVNLISFDRKAGLTAAFFLALHCLFPHCKRRFQSDIRFPSTRIQSCYLWRRFISRLVWGGGGCLVSNACGVCCPDRFLLGNLDNPPRRQSMQNTGM